MSGHLWHDNFALDSIDGIQIASPTGEAPVTVVGGSDEVMPWADGTQYVTRYWKVSPNETEVRIVDTATKAVIHGVVMPLYYRSLKPSPVDKIVVMGAQGQGTASSADIVIINVATLTELKRFPANGPVDWLPDGRYLRLDGTTLIAGRFDGGEETLGELQTPDGLVVQGLWVNPQGTKLALMLERPDPTLSDHDIWLANLDGSGFERFTSTKITSYARWSPDGSHIAFDADTGSVCNSVGCIGECHLWYAPVTSRSVTALPAAADASSFRVKDRDGTEETLGCNLIRWTN